MRVQPPNRFPYCVVWVPIPVISWLLPFVGHLGIALSSGIICDFAAPYIVGTDAMAFGWPTKYLQLDPHHADFDTGSHQMEAISPHAPRTLGAAWDRQVQAAVTRYSLERYAFFSNNCHHFVGAVLNNMRYDGLAWDPVLLAMRVFAHGRFVDVRSAVQTWAPFVALMALGTWFGRVTFLLVYLITASLLILWFVWRAGRCAGSRASSVKPASSPLATCNSV